MFWMLKNDGESENKEGFGKRGCSFLAGASGRECLGGDIRTGLCSSEKGTLAYKLDREQMDNEVPFPRPAQMEEPSVVLRRLERLGSDAHAGKNIVFRGEDWTTKGDWCGKYGHTRATLCATNAPMSNSEFKAKPIKFRTLSSVPGHPGYKGALSPYWIQGLMGLNRKKGDALRWWVHSIKEMITATFFSTLRIPCGQRRSGMTTEKCIRALWTDPIYG